MKELQAIIDLPLQIDTSNPRAMERALRVYNGKALINSVNGKAEVMDEIFPLVARYGGAVVALCLDEMCIRDRVSATAGDFSVRVYSVDISRPSPYNWNCRRFFSR